MDVVDQMARKYNVKAGSFRWPPQVLFNILDLAAINAWILYKTCTGSKISKKELLFYLAEELAGENKNIGHKSDASLASPSTSKVRKSCKIGYCKKNRSNNFCIYCKKIICGKCTNKILYICKKCVQ